MKKYMTAHAQITSHDLVSRQKIASLALNANCVSNAKHTNSIRGH